MPLIDMRYPPFRLMSAISLRCLYDRMTRPQRASSLIQSQPSANASRPPASLYTSCRRVRTPFASVHPRAPPMISLSSARVALRRKADRRVLLQFSIFLHLHKISSKLPPTFRALRIGNRGTFFPSSINSSDVLLGFLSWDHKWCQPI